MDEPKNSPDESVWFLQERAKELNCLYAIDELLNQPDADLDRVCNAIAKKIPPGWQHSDVCEATITIRGKTFRSSNFKETPWKQSAEIRVQDGVAGEINVYYTKKMPEADKGPFLKEEARLISTIADRLGHFIKYKRFKEIFEEYRIARRDLSNHQLPQWRIALNLLRQTDRDLYVTISRRLLNYLCWSGIKEAQELLQHYGMGQKTREDDLFIDENRPHEKSTVTFSETLCDETFLIADRHMEGEQILAFIKKWIQEDKLSFLTRLMSENLPLTDVAETIRRYSHLVSEEMDLPQNTRRGVQISLIRRMLSDHMQNINVASNYVEIRDFQELLNHMIFHHESHGKLGGKSAGLFLANHILKKAKAFSDKSSSVKVPKTWYLPSDVILYFVEYNHLNEVMEQKYKDINQIRLEYPRIIQTFKNCRFPPDILQGLSVALDDFGKKPLIVRSSSLLEDRVGAAFSGKYKSLFIANQGSKQERLEALTDAIAEVFASIFGPDPIEYRAERGLLDFIEEMGIMIQEVVGTRTGDYFLPAFAGVALSRNEFRWSPRIKREDGLIRMVPGLGTRAVDRLADDYPVLIAPGRTGLRVNATPDEVVRYSPKKVDVINLLTNNFETMEVEVLLKEFGSDIPGMDKIVSIYDGHLLRKPVGVHLDFDRDDLVVTFEKLISDTRFVPDIHDILKVLEEELGFPVDIEFASDGKDFYLLQCRAQSHQEGIAPAPIPRNLPGNKIIFSANRYISNGSVPDITHIVYVDPEGYDQLSERSDLLSVGRAVGKLNKLLPKRQFILMGPGRWGSRGDIKLGVNVTYSEINNTAVLIEIARQKGNYIPDLSFGTHFFQDLVEAGIRYLPLYPDDEGIVFNNYFLKASKNILPEVLPEFAHLADTVKLIEVPKNTDGLRLRVLMNADLDEAVGILAEPSAEKQPPAAPKKYEDRPSENYWAWRMKMAEHIASEMDSHRFGVEAFYIFGSTKNGTAGLGSDIDLLIHFRGTGEQRDELMLWLEGWSLCLDEINYLRTGYRTGGLLDVHLVTDQDIAKKTSYAAKIGAPTDAAKPLPLKKK